MTSTASLLRRNSLLMGTAALLGLLLVGQPADVWAGDVGTQIGSGLVIPPLDPVKGKHLYISKGCIVCHAVNGVGGRDALALDASTMAPKMNPFDLVAGMWNQAAGMIAMQNHELGGQITFNNGQEIADIIAFLHDANVQKTVSRKDLTGEAQSHLRGNGDQGGAGNMMNGQAPGSRGAGMMGGQGMMGNLPRTMMQGN